MRIRGGIMRDDQQLIIEVWDKWGGEKSSRQIAAMLNLNVKYVSEVIRNREEIDEQWIPRRKKTILCLKCSAPFDSEGKYNRLCESCRAYVNKYQDIEEVYELGRIE
jgi:hypothetical protein